MEDLFHGIPDNVIQVTLNNIEKNLQKIGYPTKHVVERHVGITENKLKERIEEGKKWAASFHNYRIADRVIKLMLKRDFNKCIADWLRSPVGDCLTLYATFDKVVGYGYKAGEEQIYRLKGACLVLLKNAQSSWGFHVLTCYPIQREQRGEYGV